MMAKNDPGLEASQAGHPRAETQQRQVKNSPTSSF